MTVSTVEDILRSTHIGCNKHQWRIPYDGGVATLTRAELRQALEDAYDPNMPNWPAMVEIGGAYSHPLPARQIAYFYLREESAFTTPVGENQENDAKSS